MWLIRINKITTKEYNIITRTFKKIGFFPRRITPIIFIKAMFFHYLQKKSWRKISVLLNCNYIAIYSFYLKYKDNPEIKKIFHTFAESRIIVFIGNIKHFTNDDLDNNKEFLKITKNELDNIFWS